MMAQSDCVVVGIDVAKDKVDACIRSLSQRQTFPSTTEGRRALIRWLRKHKVGKAAMEASGGYERDWAKALREVGIEVRIVDPKRVRSFAKSAGRLARLPVVRHSRVSSPQPHHRNCKSARLSPYRRCCQT